MKSKREADVPREAELTNNWHKEQQRHKQLLTVSLAVKAAIIQAFPALEHDTLALLHFHEFLLKKIDIERMQNLLAQPATQENVFLFKQMICAELRRINFTRELARNPAIRLQVGVRSNQLKRQLNRSLITFSQTSELPNDIQLDVDLNVVKPLAALVVSYPLLFVRF